MTLLHQAAQNAVEASLSAINEAAKVYASGYASPHHITFTVEGLRNLIAALQQQPEPVALRDSVEHYGLIDDRSPQGQAQLAALQHQEVPREPVATLRVTLEYDDGDGPLEIVCHGTELNMRRLDARLKFLHRLEKQSNDCAASPSTTRQQEVGND